MDISLVAIVGPTGIGKTKLAIWFAQQFNGEIISADSRQVYRHMDIGTDKPTSAEMASVPHHLINILNPDQDFSLALFQDLALTAIKDISHRGRLPIIAGGSGQYVRALIEGWSVPEVAPDYKLREELEDKARKYGSLKLHKELEAIDPAASKIIDHRNVRRVIRAIEATINSKISFSKLRTKNPPGFGTLVIGLTTERHKLYENVDLRVDKMIKRGLVDEVIRINSLGYGADLASLNTIGYKEISAYLNNKISLESAVQQIKYATHRFIRRQYNWFNPADDKINWFDVQCRDTLSNISSLVGAYIKK